MVFMLNHYLSAWKRPFDFKGRSNRKEYWYFNLLTIFPFIFINILLSLLNTAIMSLLMSDSGGFEFTATFLQVIVTTIKTFSLLLVCGYLWTSIPLTVRRIRDVGMSWKWIFLALIPYFGNIFQLIFLTRTSIQEIDGKNYYLKY